MKNLQTQPCFSARNHHERGCSIGSLRHVNPHHTNVQEIAVPCVRGASHLFSIGDMSALHWLLNLRWHVYRKGLPSIPTPAQAPSTVTCPALVAAKSKPAGSAAQTPYLYSLITTLPTSPALLGPCAGAALLPDAQVFANLKARSRPAGHAVWCRC